MAVSHACKYRWSGIHESCKMNARPNTLSLLFASGLVLAGGNALGQAIATCSAPEGYAYYHHRPPAVSKQESGFQKDAITAGLTTLQRLANGEYDILFVDARKQVFSSRNDGGNVLLLRRGTDDATFLVVYPRQLSIELYTFYTDAGGAKRLICSKARAATEC